MNPIPADQLLPDELAALMHFYAEAGVSWLAEDEAIDRFEEFRTLIAAKARPAPPPPVSQERAVSSSGQSARAPVVREPPAAPIASAIAVPDAGAVEASRALAASMETVEALIEAVGTFGGCNLRNSARHTVFASGNPQSKILVVGGMPGPDDDREGALFSGAAGVILGRMLSGTGLAIADIMTINLIPWRTPGDRTPTVREVDICLPFGLRMMELIRPQAVLVLGNLSARILSGNARGGIHALRGKWFEVQAGSVQIQAFATFHPQDMITAPASKSLAWQDMLSFQAELATGIA